MDQMEGRWNGFATLSGERRRAFVQIARRVAGQEQGSRLGHMLGLTDDGSEVEAERMAEDSALRHAHVATVTIDMVRKLKTGRGVVPSSEFAWAKRHDPRFWLLISGYGRRNHVAGAVAAFAHFEVENAMGQAIPEPDFSNLADYIPEAFPASAAKNEVIA